ncbi:electron transport complex subunit RsxG [Alkalilimnicola sp. S0819]|uniref:electron transport complex subunit RsxG n=1 Tax=Alkalilimnicola sp. S0819 TaxID=2613922 RepID=UPI001261BD0C|nr:electron transport complex subunit RsxG [Alkalilimnicola sp. S0819]KAB7623197.1 electron transport complex subunit RsxG [Alkalilimnicola sp. S0819]MPQ17043.1 electron transport complex subunit RsxG [Alkalilimnicola sp. S0819]
MSLGRQMLIAAALLAGFAVAGTGLVAWTQYQTADRIAENQRQTLLDRLNQILPAAAYDNELVDDTLALDAPILGGQPPQTVYRARRRGQPVAAIFTVVAPNGYSGPIRLLVGVYRSGELAGVRVVGHAETPGLGDAVESEKSDWIHGFQGKRLGDPPAQAWKVRKDGGAFDQFTGATITPRAVVAAVKRTLEYHAAHREAIYAAPAERAPDPRPELANPANERGGADVR